jgi:hypothetical protein
MDFCYELYKLDQAPLPPIPQTQLVVLVDCMPSTPSPLSIAGLPPFEGN